MNDDDMLTNYTARLRENRQAQSSSDPTSIPTEDDESSLDFGEPDNNGRFEYQAIMLTRGSYRAPRIQFFLNDGTHIVMPYAYLQPSIVIPNGQVAYLDFGNWIIKCFGRGLMTLNQHLAREKVRAVVSFNPVQFRPPTAPDCLIQRIAFVDRRRFMTELDTLQTVNQDEASDNLVANDHP